MELPRCEQRITEVSLAELLRCFERPISEEQAWAICFQCCSKMEQLAWELCPAPHSVFIKGCGSILIHDDGTASFKVNHKSGKSIDVGSIQQSEGKLLEYLGVVIYEALDWGIDSQLERELSGPLEKLLRLMLKLDDEPMKQEVTLQDVIKACEEQLPRPSEATKHYEMTCKNLFAEYMELQKLVTIIQTSKEVHLGSLLGCYSLYLHRPTIDLALPGFSEAPLWPSVISELQAGVRLHKASERPQRCVPPKERILSPFELLLDDIQHKRYTLRKVTLVKQCHCWWIFPSPLVSLLCPLALCGAVLCLQVSERQLKECVPCETSWHEQAMAEIKQPQKLQSAAAQEKGSRPKGTCY
ncbi:SPIR2 protein, partial [Tachuris rubrigastra]|nr:SPIR2 protein [Tachuris rubrigastra]